jgi:NIMA (never in mitosis gene a)-related kinase
MITFLPPFRASTMKGLYTKVIAGKYDAIPSNFSRDLTDMLKTCLIVKPSDRANCDQILNLPFLKNH